MAEYVLKKIPELDEAFTVADTDLMVIESATGTKHITFANLKSTIPNYGYLYSVFTSLALSGNILTINHAKNTRRIRLTIYNPAGISNPYPWYIVDANNVAINFGGTIEAGEWEYLLEFWTGEGTGSYPDPIYEPAITKASVGFDYSMISSQVGLLSYSFKRYNDLVIGHVSVNFNNTYILNAERKIANILGWAPLFDFLVPGATQSTNVYESSTLRINAIGEMYVRSGYKNIDYHFNFSYYTDIT